jgi:uncharacterized protein
MNLRAEAARVIGSLVEKELTTPQQYPLTLNALIAACNQASNREPVTDYDEQTVMSVLDELKEQRLVRFVLPSHGRTAVRYRHVVDETLALDPRQRALLAVLLLRGPQTVGELRLRTDRMTEFEGLDDVERELAFLSSREEPLAESLGRRPGQKEGRWASPIVGHPTGDSDPTRGRRAEEDDPAEEPGPVGNGRTDTLPGIRAELNALRAEVGELRSDLVALRESLGG